MLQLLVVVLCLAQLIQGQQVGTQTQEAHPALTTSTCTSPTSCTSQAQSIVLDANWRWLHNVGGSTNCYTGNEWNTDYCPSTNGASCAANCALEGVDAATYTGTYAITTSGSQLSLGFVTHGPYSTNIGSRVYLMQDAATYQIFKLKNREFAFDVDVSALPCGLNGALYFSEMSADGGLSAYAGNKAGAKYGTGYCDAQCPHDIKFINGEANCQSWVPSSNDVNSGTGQYGSCCSELDIWEANSISTAFTPHPCTVVGQTRCTGTDCGDGDERYDGVCDKDGCDFNSYRMGNTSFYGPGLTINTNAVFTVVTQFITSDNTDTGDLVAIKRYYKQGNTVIENSAATYSAFPAGSNSITDDFCSTQKTLFEDTDIFTSFGGLKKMGDAMGRGMVLVMSLWDDHTANCLWLDSTYPTDASASTPGAARGTCATTSGAPADVEANSPGATVKFSNIRTGTFGTTVAGIPAPTSGSASSASTTAKSSSSGAAGSTSGTTSSNSNPTSSPTSSPHSTSSSPSSPTSGATSKPTSSPTSPTTSNANPTATPSSGSSAATPTPDPTSSQFAIDSAGSILASSIAVVAVSLYVLLLC